MDNQHVGYALETQDRPFFPGNIGQNTFVHELAHQWYGDAVAPADWNGLWVNEGMATWAPTNAGGDTETTYFNAWNGSFNWTIPPSGMTCPSQLFGWQSYTRGAMTYEALRAAIGDPAFFQLIKQWQTDFSGQTKKWTDLIDLAEQISGRDLTAFFQDWIYDNNKPAWPGKLSLVLGAAPGAGPVPAGSAMSYSLAATNTGKVHADRGRRLRRPRPRAGRRHLGALPAGLVSRRHHADVDGADDAGRRRGDDVVPGHRPARRRPGRDVVRQRIDLDPGRHLRHLLGHAHGRPAGGAPTPAGTEHLRRPVPGGRHRQGAVGRKLTARTRGCPAGTAVSSYQWFAGGKPIKGADKATYKIKRSKLGKRITVR